MRPQHVRMTRDPIVVWCLLSREPLWLIRRLIGWKLCEFFLHRSHLTPSLGVNPIEFLDELYNAKTRVLALFVVEDFVILACVVLLYASVWQTDGRMDNPIVANTGLTHCTKRLNTLNHKNEIQEKPRGERRRLFFSRCTLKLSVLRLFHLLFLPRQQTLAAALPAYTCIWCSLYPIVNDTCELQKRRYRYIPEKSTDTF